MELEDVKIEDAADANYVIRKFFNDQFKGMKMSQLEQLVLTVYNMGKKNGKAGDSEGAAEGSAEGAVDAEAKVNPFRHGNKAKTIEDIQMGNSGELIKEGTEGTISAVNGDNVTFLFEAGEDGEMFETSVPFEKLEKIA